MLEQHSDTRKAAVEQPDVLVGLIGAGIQLSRTPALHEAEARRQGLVLRYDLFDLDTMENPDLADLIALAEQGGYAGLNVTYPCKIAAMAHMDVLSDNAQAVGAINTVVFKDGKRHGHNTDLWGFATSFKTNMAGAAVGRVLLIGAGGAGVAVAHALADCGVQEMLIVDVDAARADALAQRLMQNRAGVVASAVVSVEAAMQRGIDGLVNATPMGMEKLPGSPVPAALLTPDIWVADIIYFPLETQLLAEARAAGCRVLAGTGMAVFQAVRAFALFTGLTPDAAAMMASFENFGRT